jgi:hypothetical protein
MSADIDITSSNTECLVSFNSAGMLRVTQLITKFSTFYGGLVNPRTEQDTSVKAGGKQSLLPRIFSDPDIGSDMLLRNIG